MNSSSSLHPSDRRPVLPPSHSARGGAPLLQRSSREAARQRAASDPIERLLRDHANASKMVVALRVGLLDLETPERVESALVELREAVFAHLAREEEALFPFVLGHVPELADQLDDLLAAHERVCESLARTLHFASTKASIDRLQSSFERFVGHYSRNALEESVFLQQLDATFDSGTREALRKALEGA